jgi:hypothetical protein
MSKTKKEAAGVEQSPVHVWEGAFTAFGKAFDRIKQNPEPALFFLGLYAVLSILSGIFNNAEPYLSSDYVNYGDLLYLVFLLAIPTYSLALADGKQISIREFMRFSLKKYVSVFAATLLFVLIAGVSLLLLIIPAIWTIAWFFFCTYAAVDKNMGPVAALKESKRLAANHKGKVWGLIGVSILVSIAASLIAILPYVGAVAAAAASLWASAAGALLYRWFQHQPKPSE